MSKDLEMYEERGKALDVIRAKSRELDEVLSQPNAHPLQALLVLQELRAATGILRAGLLDAVEKN